MTISPWLKSKCSFVKINTDEVSVRWQIVSASSPPLCFEPCEAGCRHKHRLLWISYVFAVIDWLIRSFMWHSGTENGKNTLLNLFFFCPWSLVSNLKCCLVNNTGLTLNLELLRKKKKKKKPEWHPQPLPLSLPFNMISLNLTGKLFRNYAGVFTSSPSRTQGKCIVNETAQITHNFHLLFTFGL